jgi:hypothetical protein
MAWYAMGPQRREGLLSAECTSYHCKNSFMNMAIVIGLSSKNCLEYNLGEKKYDG